MQYFYHEDCNLPVASLTKLGITQLSDTVPSTSITQAATISAVSRAYHPAIHASNLAYTVSNHLYPATAFSSNHTVHSSNSIFPLTLQAQSTADTALTAAEAAQTTADAGLGAATAAGVSAAAAATAASSAYSLAATANAAALANQATLAVHDTRITSAQSAAEAAGKAASTAQQTADGALEKTQHWVFSSNSIQNLYQPTLALSFSNDQWIELNKSLRASTRLQADAAVISPAWISPCNGECRYTDNHLKLKHTADDQSGYLYLAYDGLQFKTGAAGSSPQLSLDSNGCCYVASNLQMPKTAIIRATQAATLDTPYTEGILRITPEALRFFTLSNDGLLNTYEKQCFSVNSNGIFALLRCALLGREETVTEPDPTNPLLSVTRTKFPRLEVNLTDGLRFGSGIAHQLGGPDRDLFKVDRFGEVSCLNRATGLLEAITSNACPAKGGLALTNTGLTVAGTHVITSAGELVRRVDPEQQAGFKVSPSGYLTMGGLRVNPGGIITSSCNASFGTISESGTPLSERYAPLGVSNSALWASNTAKSACNLGLYCSNLAGSNSNVVYQTSNMAGFASNMSGYWKRSAGLVYTMSNLAVGLSNSTYMMEVAGSFHACNLSEAGQLLTSRYAALNTSNVAYWASNTADQASSAAAAAQSSADAALGAALAAGTAAAAAATGATNAQTTATAAGTAAASAGATATSASTAAAAAQSTADAASTTASQALAVGRAASNVAYPASSTASTACNLGVYSSNASTFGSNAAGYWQRSGSNTYTMSNTGFGISNPSYLVHVAGSLYATNLHENGQLLTAKYAPLNTSNAAYWGSNTALAACNLGLYSSNAASFGSNLTGYWRRNGANTYTTSNLGIGLSNPAYSLDVNGSINASNMYQSGVLLSALYAPLTASNVAYWASNAATNAASRAVYSSNALSNYNLTADFTSLSNAFHTSSNSGFVVDKYWTYNNNSVNTASNVAIGDIAAPAGMLHVNGKTHIQSDLQQDLTNNTMTNAYPLYINAPVDANARRVGIAFAHLGAPSAIPGAAIIHQRLAGSSYGALHFATKNTSNIFGQCDIKMTIVGSNVGIGTQTPSNRLEVAGTVKATSFLEGGYGVPGNFGQHQPHATFTDFNSPDPTLWGWNYVQGSSSGPNSVSSQWYREIVSLGSEYKIRGLGAYSMELAYPRFNQSTAGVWMRTIENGTGAAWTQVGGQTMYNNMTINNASIGIVGSYTATWAGFSHKDKHSEGNYAILQSSSGQTLVNSALNQTTEFRINNNTVASISSVGMNVDVPLYANGSVLLTVKNFGTLNNLGAYGRQIEKTANYSIWASQRVKGLEFDAVSDRRLKTDIESFEAEECLRVNDRLQTRRYRLLSDDSVKVGVIAQEVVEEFPYCVTHISDQAQDIFLVDYNQITSLHIGAIQHLTKQVRELQAEVTTLKTKLDSI